MTKYLDPAWLIPRLALLAGLAMLAYATLWIAAVMFGPA